MKQVTVIGGGPAGAAAALAALAQGSGVTLYEQSPFPRHKVCGEFLSPGVAPLLEALRVWPAFAAARPALLRRCVLHFGAREKSFALPEPAWSLSRYALDRLLLDSAVERGAALIRERAQPRPGAVLAHGRAAAARRGTRLFGFKAHFRGPGNDAVELFFRRGRYAGVSLVEDGFTNVCGLAPETGLRELDAVLHSSGPLRERLGPLERVTDWFFTGPLVFGFGAPSQGYPAGDALGFVDPFTGSGILGALITGRLAGLAALRETPRVQYLAQCREALGRQYRAAAVLRSAVAMAAAGALAPFIPGRMLYALTRPQT